MPNEIEEGEINSDDNDTTTNDDEGFNLYIEEKPQHLTTALSRSLLVFNTDAVQLRLKEILVKHLHDKFYQETNIGKWICEIIQDIEKDELITLRHYKRIIQVTVMQSNPATIIHNEYQCFYDQETDSSACYTFTNDTITCTALVFALFAYNVNVNRVDVSSHSSSSLNSSSSSDDSFSA